jgi:hypothetical protein
VLMNARNDWITISHFIETSNTSGVSIRPLQNWVLIQVSMDELLDPDIQPEGKNGR